MASLNDLDLVGSDSIPDFSCSVCKDDDLNVEANHFCEDCLKFYCEKCLTFHTKIHKRHVVLGRKDVDKWVGQGDTLITCNVHPTKVLELLCDDHAELCCHLCVSLNHRMCRSISLVSELAKGIMIDTMTDFKRLPAKVNKVAAHLNQIRQSKKENQNSLKASEQSILTKIKTLRKTLTKLLDTLEKRTLEQMDSVLADLHVSLQKDIDKCGLIHDQLKALLDAIKARDKDSESSAYIGHIKCQDKMQEANSLIQDTCTSAKLEATVTFMPDTQLEQLLLDLQDLGTIQRSEQQPTGQTKQLCDQTKVFKVKEKTLYAMNKKTNKNGYDIRGITELPGGEIVLVDYKNCNVKVMNSKYKMIAHNNLPEFPRDICHISDNDVAVAIDNWKERHEVHFLTVSACTINFTRKFSVDHECASISHYGGLLYIGSFTALYLYNIAGTPLKKIYEDLSCSEVTVNRFAFSIDRKKIYIPVSSHNKVITIDNAGNILATLQDPDLRWPYRVIVNDGGHVFVCSYYANTVVQVDQEGKTKLSTLIRREDGITKPQALWYSTSKDRLMVGGAQKDIVVIELQ